MKSEAEPRWLCGESHT